MAYNYYNYRNGHRRKEYSLLLETTDGYWLPVAQSYYKEDLVRQGKEHEEDHTDNFTGDWDIVLGD